jgi:hypothetical protein
LNVGVEGLRGVCLTRAEPIGMSRTNAIGRAHAYFDVPAAA